jgi:hypothetical protein
VYWSCLQNINKCRYYTLWFCFVSYIDDTWNDVFFLFTTDIYQHTQLWTWRLGASRILCNVDLLLRTGYLLVVSHPGAPTIFTSNPNCIEYASLISRCLDINTAWKTFKEKWPQRVGKSGDFFSLLCSNMHTLSRAILWSINCPHFEYPFLYPSSRILSMHWHPEVENITFCITFLLHVDDYLSTSS